MQNQTRRIHAEMLMFFERLEKFVHLSAISMCRRIKRLTLFIVNMQYFYCGRVELVIGIVLTAFLCVEETNVCFSARQAEHSKVTNMTSLET